MQTLKAEENPKLRDPSARQIDFRQFFPSPPDILSASHHPTVAPDVSEIEITKKRLGNPLRCARVGGSDWANMTFVVVTILGGLFLSVRYFGGPESFRAKTSWSREFLYQRPASIESFAKIDTLASSQRDAPLPKPALIAERDDNSAARKPIAQINRPMIAPPPGPTNNGLPFVPATTSNPSSSGAQQNGIRGDSGSSQASKGSGTTSGKNGPTAPTSAGPTDKDPKTPAGPSRKEGAGKQDPQPGRENCVKPDNRRISNAQQLSRVEGLRRSQENMARAARNVNGPAGGNFRAFNSNRAGSFGGPGNGMGGGGHH